MVYGLAVLPHDRVARFERAAQSVVGVEPQQREVRQILVAEFLCFVFIKAIKALHRLERNDRARHAVALLDSASDDPFQELLVGSATFGARQIPQLEKALRHTFDAALLAFEVTKLVVVGVLFVGVGGRDHGQQADDDENERAQHGCPSVVNV